MAEIVEVVDCSVEEIVEVDGEEEMEGEVEVEVEGAEEEMGEVEEAVEVVVAVVDSTNIFF